MARSSFGPIALALALAGSVACSSDPDNGSDGSDGGGLPGDPAAPAAEAIPDDDCMTDDANFSNDHPDLPGGNISHNTVLIVFTAETTVGEANEVLASVDAEVVCGVKGTANEPGVTVVRTQTGTHEELIPLLATLRDSDLVLHAVADIMLGPTIVSRPAAGNPAMWTWEDPATGGNWGLEAMGVPALWNFNRVIEERGTTVAVDVIDVGFPMNGGHPDLAGNLVGIGGTGDHGTHVAGTIGATFDNGIGVDGVNPFAAMTFRGFGQGWSAILAQISRAEDTNAVVVNMSLGYNWRLYDPPIDTETVEDARDRAKEDGEVVSVVLAAMAARGDLPMLVVAAGNDSRMGRQRARWSSPMANAAIERRVANIVVVEAAQQAGAGHTRASFSNIEGLVSAPGVGIWSTAQTSPYISLQGTSMATPHVSGLVSYLYALLPDLPRPTQTSNPVLTAMEDHASSVGDGASGFVDAFKTAIELGGEDLVRQLVNIDDGTRDGNDRTESQEGEPSTGIDMRDFRRFRDWLLQTENDPALKLDGPSNHTKRDLNRDTVVDAAAQENVYPRGDFNGDGSLSRTASVDLPHVGTVTDLNMLERLFSDANYTVDRLPALLDSGDLDLNATACLDEPDIATVRITVTPAGGGMATEMRDHQVGAERQVYTLPVGSYTVTADALAPDGSMVTTEDRPIDVGLGEDVAWQPLCGASVGGGLAVGASHTCALAAGDTYCWGSNTYGQVGDGSMAFPGMPVGVIGLTDATSLGASGAHSCAVRVDRTVVCWGANDVGQLGNGGGGDTTEPVAVAALTDIALVGAGGADSGTGFSCALDRNGDVWCWGANTSGQLAGRECASVCAPGTEAWSTTGNPARQACLDCRNARQNQATPRKSSVTGATALSLGLRHACAIVGSGTVLCWGSNAEGQLGVRGQEPGPMLTTDDPMPVCLSWDPDALTCLQTLDDAISVSAGNFHTCAVLRDGTALCWGFQGSDGRLGDGSRLVQLIPVTVMNVTGATKIAAGGNHSCAVTGSGDAYCWGANATGTLGDGTNIGSTLPVQVLDLNDATSIDVGDQHSCALRTDAPLVCWGRHGAGPNNFEPIEIPLR